jgi:choline-sulfatase
MPRHDRTATARISMLLTVGLLAACARQPAPAAPPRVRGVVLITIDTLRADRLGAYGYKRARTPVFDALARRGARFDRAFAAAPITLPSHASLLTGRYPQGHGARHNGMRIGDGVPLLTEAFARSGFATGAFVGAFPLDRRFGLTRGFQVYGDRMPRTGETIANERPGRAAADEAIAWLRGLGTGRFFLWVHFFEPHAPYGAPGDTRPVEERYDDEIAEADRQAGRVLDALGDAARDSVIVIAADHGEAFGEHGEIAHSIFIYDTTLRVPLVVAGPEIGARTVESPVSLVDVAPTLARLAGLEPFDADGVDLSPALKGGTVTDRQLYAESFAPLLDFGWNPLRSVRQDGWKVIDAPRPELYQVSADPDEQRDVAASETARLAALREIVDRYSSASLAARPPADRESAARLQALGYVGTGRPATGSRADPKDRRQLAADMARVASGELRGGELERALRGILAVDPGNPQASMRLGFALSESGRCNEAVPHFRAAIANGIPGADPHLGVARCHAVARRFDAAAAELRAADRAEADNPVVLANLGIVLSDGGRPSEAITPLDRAVTIDPGFHEARFNLAIAYARAGNRVEAARHAEELLRRLPAAAPQRPEIERLLGTVRQGR